MFLSPPRWVCGPRGALSHSVTRHSAEVHGHGRVDSSRTVWSRVWWTSHPSSLMPRATAGPTASELTQRSVSTKLEVRPSPSPSPSPMPSVTPAPGARAAKHVRQPRSLAVQAADLLFTVAGIYVCYIYYAVLQEQLTTLPAADGTHFNSPLFLMLVQCAFNTALVWPLLWWKDSSARARLRRKEQLPHDEMPSSECAMQNWQYALLALSYLGGMESSYLALQYISYPTQVLIKSCKMLPVMLLGAVLFRKRYSLVEVVAVLTLTTGIWGFFSFADEAPTAKGAKNTDTAMSTFLGIALSMVSLTCDGVTGAGQDHWVARYKPSAEKLMFEMNRWSVLQLLVACFLFTNQGFEGMAFVQRQPATLVQLCTFGVVSALGQMFIFHCVTTFGALALAILTSTRKFFTILASVVWFGHHINAAQWTAVAAVFAGLFIDIGKKAFSRHKKAKAQIAGTADTKKE